MINMIAKLLSILNSETEPNQISLGFCFAMILGFTPFLSLHNLFVLLFVMSLRVNLSTFFLGLPLFAGIAYMLDPVFHSIGYKLLTMPALNGLWTTMYNSTIWRLENFNNSIVMGSLVTSVLLFIPFYFLFNMLIQKYRQNFLTWVQSLKITQILKASKVYSAYQALAG